jgi:hypothetical protein
MCRQMEKLIELLNEYVEKHNKSDLYYTFELEDNWWLFCYDDVTDHKWWTMQDEAMVICSKKYWFIKWLVENNKIDFHIWSRWEKYLEYPIWSDNLDEVHDYKDIIQRLSISDTPIEDLISYLK